jgi:hypothetical protein
MAAQGFHVVYQRIGVVMVQGADGAAAAAATLVKQYCAA